MSEEYPPIPPVAEIVAEMERAWDALNTVVDAADTGDLIEKTDAAGWSVKDHLAHLEAWANSVLVMIRDRQPQWAVVGIDPALLENESDYDRQNEVIRQRTIDTTLDEAREALAATHNEFVRMLRSMTDEAIRRPCNDYVPGSGEFEIAHKVLGNTYMHYDEHRVYIERILAM